MIFRKRYFFLALVLFFVEVLIALFVKDAIVRPYVGDFLVVILIYCFLRSFLRISVAAAALVTLLFAYLVEFLQYLNFIYVLNLQHLKLAHLILGNRFEWIDMLAYTLGVAAVLLIEKRYTGKHSLS